MQISIFIVGGLLGVAAIAAPLGVHPVIEAAESPGAAELAHPAATQIAAVTPLRKLALIGG